MKDSGYSLIGDIPEDWNIYRMKFFLESPVSDGPHETPLFQDKGIPFFSVDSIQNNKLIFKNSRFISKEDHKRFSKKCRPQKNDILFGKAASVGKVAFVDTENEFNVWSPLAVIRLKKKFEPKFFYYFMISSSFQNEVLLNVNFNTQGNIGMNQIENLKFIEPPLKDQKKIVNFLDNFFMKIEFTIKKNQELVKLLNEKKQSLIKKIITKGLNSSVLMKDSGIEFVGKIPINWEVSKLKEISEVIDPHPSHRAPILDDEGIPYAGIGDFDVNGEIIQQCRTVPEESLREQQARFRIQKGDIGIGRVGTLGKLIRLKKNDDYCISPTLAIIKPRVYPDYLFHILSSEYFQEQLKVASTGSTRRAVGMQTLRVLNVVFTNNQQEQKEIVEFLNKQLLKIDPLIKTTTEQISKLREFQKEIIFSAVTGKIRIDII